MRDGFYVEVTPLVLNRARIITTDGAIVDEFW